MTQKETPWAEKYRPQSFSEIVGQEEALTKLKEYLTTFRTSKHKAIILHGPPGIGKTTIAEVAAKETNSEIFELNASDLRNKKKLQEVLKPALEQQSLVKKNKIILVDEVDGVSVVDWGGLGELLSLISITPYPLIITANDVWNKKLSSLRKKTELIELKNINYVVVRDVLFNILRKENLFLNSNLVTSIAVRSKGDIRAAINDLQSVSRTRDPSIISLDERNKEINIFNALKKIFKEKPTNETLQAFSSVNMNIDEIILWVEENIPIEYSGEELEKACHALSNTDLFKGRIYKQQYWRFLVYENIFLSYGISAAKKTTKPGFTSYKKPSRILKIWLNNQRTAKKKSISQKYAQHVHIGAKRALNEFPIIKNIIKSNQQIQKELKLNSEEIEYLNKNQLKT